jgi:hypothetical protein
MERQNSVIQFEGRMNTVSVHILAYFALFQSNVQFYRLFFVPNVS